MEIRELEFSYKRKKKILSGVNLNIEPGNVYGLFGLNGVGKTTLLNIMAGMLFPDSGTCTLDGVETRLRKPETMSQLFVVPEQFELPKVNGDTFVNLHAPFYPMFDNSLMQQMLKILEVDATDKLHKLSFGQQKKYLIAFAFAINTQLLIMDEPTNGLDIPSKSQFRKAIASLDTSGRSMIISTHQVRDLGTMIDHMIVLKEESVVFNQSLEKILASITIKKIPEGSDIPFIYAEEALGGVKAIIAGNQTEEEELDLELMFNAIISETEKINEVMA